MCKLAYRPPSLTAYLYERKSSKLLLPRDPADPSSSSFLSFSNIGRPRNFLPLVLLCADCLLADLQTSRLIARKRASTDLSFACASLSGEGEGCGGGSQAGEVEAKEKSLEAVEVIKKISSAYGLDTAGDSCRTLDDAVRLSLLSKALEKVRKRDKRSGRDGGGAGLFSSSFSFLS